MQIQTVSMLVTLLLIASTSVPALAEETEETETNEAVEGEICYNVVIHTISVQASESECNSFMYLENYTMMDGSDICYNSNTHMVNQDDNTTCSTYDYFENYTMDDGQDVCYNMLSHAVNGDGNNTCTSYTYMENYTMGDGTSFTGCYNTVTHSTDENMSQEECEAYDYYENYGATVFTGCYNTVNHWMDANTSSEECTSFAYYENYGATVYTGCYNIATHQTSSETQSICGGYMWTAAVNLAMTASATTIHTTLVEALSAANLVTTLSGEDNYTIFAPSDKAFAAAGIDLNDPELSVETLTDILLYHVIPGKIMLGDLAIGMTTVTTANGDDLMINVTESTFMVGSEMAMVTIADIPASNGVIHVIDKVLMPPVDVIDIDESSDIICDVTIGISPNGYAFSPSVVSIEVGQTVCWSWSDAEMGHNIKEVDEYKATKFVEDGITSGIPDIAVEFHHTFTENTTFYYACEPHISVDMLGKVIVGDGGIEPMDENDSRKANSIPGFLGVTMLLAILGAVLYSGINRSEEL